MKCNFLYCYLCSLYHKTSTFKRNDEKRTTSNGQTKTRSTFLLPLDALTSLYFVSQYLLLTDLNNHFKLPSQWFQMADKQQQKIEEKKQNAQKHSRNYLWQSPVYCCCCCFFLFFMPLFYKFYLIAIETPINKLHNISFTRHMQFSMEWN